MDRHPNLAPQHTPGQTSEETLTFTIDADVSVIHTSGTEIHRPSVAAAIRMIRRRHSRRPPLVGLAAEVISADDTVFVPQWWLVGETETHLIDSPAAERQQHPDYLLTYTNYRLAAPGSDFHPIDREAISDLLHVAADETDRPVALSGELLGLNTEPVSPTQQPTDDTQLIAQPQTPTAAASGSDTQPELRTGRTGPEPLTELAFDASQTTPPSPPKPASAQAITESAPSPDESNPPLSWTDRPSRQRRAVTEDDPADDAGLKAMTAFSTPAGSAPLLPVLAATETQQTLLSPSVLDQGTTQRRSVQQAPAGADPAASSLAVAEVAVELAVTDDMAQTPVFVEPTDEPDTLADDLLDLATTDQSPETVDEADGDPTRSPTFAARVTSAAAEQARKTRSAVEKHPRRVKATAVAAGGLLVVGLIGGGTFLAASTGDQPDQPAGVTSAPAAESSAEQIDSDYTMSLWSLPPSKTQKLSVFASGVVSVNDGRLILRDSLSADIITKVALDTPVQWTAEARFGDTDAVTVRTEDRVHLITETGETADWKISDDQEVSVLGTRPIIRGDEATEVLTLDGAQQVEGNPALYSAAADEEFLLQIDAGEPRVVAVPYADDARSEDVALTVPSDRAEFVKHLAVGHGLALALWQVGDQNYYGVHSLEEDGESTAFLPTPTSAEDAPRWQFGRGLDLAVIEGSAIKLSDGTLAATAPEGETLTTALGTAAISEDDTGARHVLIDGTAYEEDDRIIGFSDNGTVWVREPDGSVTALSKLGGKS